MPKFTAPEREIIKTLVASLSLKRIPDLEILKEVERQTHKSISQRYLTAIKQQIKADTFKWYSQLRESRFDFLYQYKERINEIMDLQKRHYKIVEDNSNNPSIQQTSLAELHKLSITLSNLYEVAPVIVNSLDGKDNDNNSISSIPQQDKEIIV